MASATPRHRPEQARIGGQDLAAGFRRSDLPADGFIRISPIMPLPEWLGQMGVDAGPVIRAAGLDPKSFDDPESIIPYAAAGRLLVLCAEQTACPHIGLIIGERRGIGALGAVGMVVREAPDVRSALLDLVRFLSLHDRGAVPSLEMESDRVTLSYAMFAPQIPGSEIIADIAAVMGLNILRELCGASWALTELSLPRRKPADTLPYRKMFKAPIRFGDNRVALSFSADWLSARVSRADPDLHRLLRRQLEQLAATASSDFADQMRRIVRTLVIDGDCSVDRVARLAGVNKRTLNRRLHAEKTSTRELIEETRLQAAQQMLADRSVPLTEIAAALGYSQGSAFTRAFHRWTGVSPSQWRLERQGPVSGK